MALARLDHVIYHVSDIEAVHQELTTSLPEAWPVGRFWPQGRTSGVALGGFNLELMQRDSCSRKDSCGFTLVFEPTSFESAVAALDKAGIRAYDEEKMESDPELLQLRGFTGVASLLPQLICHNLYPFPPGDPSEAVLDFFICDYSPYLKTWLSPEHPRLRTTSRATGLIYGTPRPREARELLDRLGYSGDVEIRFESYADCRILGIETEAGPLSSLAK